jgi:pimeloyl-ACP methyl ester carboxylesterase
MKSREHMTGLISARHKILGFAVAVFLAGCTHLAIEDCPDNEVLGKNDPTTARLRTSHYRVVLADRAAAAARVVPYALMSAYAYRMGAECNDPGNDVRIDPERESKLLQWLKMTSDDSSTWTLDSTLATRDAHGNLGCEDNEGLMYNVWHRKVGNQTHVVIAFRGTSGAGDWLYGNLWWFTRAFLTDNQLTRAAKHAEAIIKLYDAKAATTGEDKPRFVTTGHSLGGGLAQHVLYAWPLRVEQAIVFDPSSVTGFAGVTKANQAAACTCEPDALRDLGVRLVPEARILRVYQTYEVLANLRIFHKLFFLPERHVQELRFPFEAPWNPISRHGMYTFAERLVDAAAPHIAQSRGSGWFASRAGDVCTNPLISAQKQSCQRPVSENSTSVCPQ